MIRKIVYVSLICVLIVPLFLLSQPSTQAGKDGKGGQHGGFLAAYRDQNHLSQSDLGEIDPTSETIRLGTLGMRGVAGALLWLEAQEFQKKKDWTELRATLDQISKLQPHSIYVWRYQAWNISYNISVAFDDYHDKYFWVIEGIKFMHRGVELNPHEPRLAWDVGWFTAHKIGRDDAAKQYRRLFEKDEEFQKIALPPEGGPANLVLSDNWHVGKAWFISAENRVDERHPVHGMAEAIFYSNAPMCQFYYADNLEKDGHFGETAQFAWRQSTREWDRFGEHDIPISSFDAALTEGKPIQLNRREFYEDELKKVTQEIDKMEPGVRERIYQAKLKALRPEQRKAWDTPVEKRTPDQARIAYDLPEDLAVTNEAVARGLNLPEEKKKEAIKRARYGENCEKLARYIDRERKMVNFDFWRLRAEAEETDDCRGARQFGYRADDNYRSGDRDTAKDLYEKSLNLWRKVLDRFTGLKEDVSIGGDLVDLSHRYFRCLEQLDQKRPKPFILQEILDRHDHDQPLPPSPPVKKSPEPAKNPPAPAKK